MKNELHATMLQEKLSALSIMCIENDKIHSLPWKVKKKKVLMFKIIYCANTVHLSFTQSSLYNSASIMLSCSSILMFPSARINTYFDFRIFGASYTWHSLGPQNVEVWPWFTLQLNYDTVSASANHEVKTTNTKYNRPLVTDHPVTDSVLLWFYTSCTWL
jgi:hypothetical protein